MARYDRLAMLPVPAAADAFGGWLALRDLTGRERDAELGRRLRLHFLVLRPLLRLLARGEAVANASFVAQIGRAREAASLLPARDPQRGASTELLAAIGGRAPEPLARAALCMAEQAQRWEHRSAAIAYAQCALRLARAEELHSLELAAHARLAQIALSIAAAHEAETHARQAATLALQLGEQTAWAHATTQLAAAIALRADVGSAFAVLAEVQARARLWHAPDVGAIGTIATCRHLLSAGDAEAALEHAWHALQTTPRAAQRAALLEEIATALTALGLFREAEHCCALLAARAASAPERLITRARTALLRAEAGDADGYARRAAALMERPAALPAAARLQLARGAFLVGQPQEARRHAMAAAQLARAQLLAAEAREAAELLATLDRTAGAIVAVPRPARGPNATALRIAEQVLTLGETLAPSLL